ncbi:MAG TPA: MFS transporter [Verrucomicrobiae bacterium]|nr:MFS transporter [Verrucomicrobiae bacterium]
MKFMDLVNRYDRAIWIRVIGTILTTVTSFAIRPFLAIYLYDKTGSVYYAGLILGLAPLMGILTNLLGGGFADKYGRKPVMVLSLLFQSIPMFGFIFAATPLQFCLVSMLNGMASSLFFPAANAQIADIVPEQQRAEVFALMHTALNVGAAVGPMLGLMLVSFNQQLVFFLSGISLLIYCALVYALIPETLRKKSTGTAVRQAPLRLREHKLLMGLTALALPVTLLYSQVEANFPIYLRGNFDNYLTIFTGMMTMNGTIVVLSAVWLAKRTENMFTPNVLLVGYLLFATVGIGYGFGPLLKSIPLLFAAEFIFTVAECITFPNQQKMISLIAPPEMRGRYFSLFGLNWGLAKSVGPLLGGLVLTRINGLSLFLFLALLLILAGLILHRLTSGKVMVLQPSPAQTSK